MSLITLTAGDATAEISLRGAELMKWRVEGHDLLWQADPTFWDGTSPILFPVVGKVARGQVRIGNRDYPMQPHGFARTRMFSIEERTEDRVTMVTTSDAETYHSYPYRFCLIVRYALAPTAFSVSFEIRNQGPDCMPYAIGFHPGFRWPLHGASKAGHRIEFAEVERDMVSTQTPDGLLSADLRRIPMQGTRLPLEAALFAAGPLCFLDLNSTSVRFMAPDGKAITFDWHNFPHLALWTKPGAPFLCVEPWTSHSDPENFAGELNAKPGMRQLPLGHRAYHRISMRWQRAPAGNR